MIEYEKKILLSHEEYLVIEDMAPKCTQIIKQINYYYDTDDFEMNRNGITCRIRAKDGRYIATIKQHGIGREDCNVEKSKEVSNEKDKSLFVGMDVNLKGKVTTIRAIMFYDHRVKVMLDKNTYLGVKDYELEVEYVPEEEKYAQKIINTLARMIHLQNPQTNIEEFCGRAQKAKSKSERFFMRKMSLKSKENKKVKKYDLCKFS